jgi:cholesterol oxidase
MKNGLSRRNFIRLSALGGMVSALPLNGCIKSNLSANDYHYDAIVIGSGFGGAVAALRLCESGVRTLVLEMGKQYTVQPDSNVFSPNFPANKFSTWLRNTTELPFGPNLPFSGTYVGVLDRMEYPNMHVYRNICLGGGSISNGGVLLEPREDHFSSFMFDQINYGELKQKYFPLVRNMLRASKMPDDLFNSSYYIFAQVAKRHAIQAGFEIIHADSFYDFDIWRREALNQIKKSALNGELLYGNNNGIKNSLERNYLAQATATGNLTIQTLTKANSIRKNGKGLFEMEAIQINELGQETAYTILTSNYLFVCAGSIGTSELLVKARDTGTLPDLNEEVGKDWGPNGNSFAMRSQLRESTGNMHCSPPTLSVADYANPIAPLTAMQDIFPLGIDLKTLLMVGQPYSETKGTFVYDAVKNTVQLQWPANGLDQANEAMKQFIDKMNTVNGGVLDRTFIPSGVSKGFTYHPLGGAVLGKASDLFGRVKGYKNLYALDGSMLPGNCALVNPTLTITALAERNMEKIIQEDFN